MPLSFAPVFDAQATNGRFRENIYDVTLDNSYPTGGEAITAQNVGLSALYSIDVIGQSTVAGTAPTASYRFQWDFKNGKLQAFASGTAAGTIGGNVTVVGGGIGEATGINPDSNAGVLSKAAATNRTIPIATYLGAAPTFTGTAGAGIAPAEVAAATDLSTVVVRVRAIGV